MPHAEGGVAYPGRRGLRSQGAGGEATTVIRTTRSFPDLICTYVQTTYVSQEEEEKEKKEKEEKEEPYVTKWAPY
jgi:hypothetical protein